MGILGDVARGKMDGGGRCLLSDVRAATEPDVCDAAR
jgi:hypothetical protein